MTARSSHAASTVLSAAALGKNFGYRFDGDMVTLNAEIARCNPETVSCDWRVQLWACREPFEGGHIEGIKIADVPATNIARAPTSVVASALARLPANEQYRSMVMTVASQEGKFATIHDFANFPQSQSFVLPRMRGNVGFHLDGDVVHIEVAAIENPREANNVSGTLSLELWALSERYDGGDFEGTGLASVSIGTLRGQTELHNVSFALPLNDAATGEQYVVLMLREWTAGGYITRDFSCFPQRVHFAAPAQESVEPAAVDETARLLTRVVDTVTAPAKKRAHKAVANEAKESSSKPAVESELSTTKKDVLRSRGRGRKLLAKVVAVAQPRGKANGNGSAVSVDKRN